MLTLHRNRSTEAAAQPTAPPQCDFGEPLVGIGFERLATFGVSGLASNLDWVHPSTIPMLRRSVLDHGLVCIRGFGTSERAFSALASALGSPRQHPLDSLLGRDRTVSVIQDDGDRPPAEFPWHTDLSWLPNPPRVGMLQALEIPAVGGDTMWGDLTGLYRNLDPGMRRVIGRLRLEHRIDPSLIETVARNHGVGVATALVEAHPPVLRPLVRYHPQSGLPLLSISPMYACSLVDDNWVKISNQTTGRLLAELAQPLDDPAFHTRWRWNEGDLVLWDEHTTVHKALGDHYPARRRVRRTTLDV